MKNTNSYDCCWCFWFTFCSYKFVYFSWSHDFKLVIFISKSLTARKLAWKVPRKLSKPMIFLYALVRVILMDVCKTPLSVSHTHTHTPWNAFSHFAHHHEFHNCPTIRLRRHRHRIFIHDQDHNSPFLWTCFLVWVVRVEQIYWLVELLHWIRFSFSFRANNILSNQPRTITVNSYKSNLLRLTYKTIDNVFHPRRLKPFGKLSVDHKSSRVKKKKILSRNLFTHSSGDEAANFHYNSNGEHWQKIA